MPRSDSKLKVKSGMLNKDNCDIIQVKKPWLCENNLVPIGLSMTSETDSLWAA